MSKVKRPPTLQHMASRIIHRQNRLNDLYRMEAPDQVMDLELSVLISLRTQYVFRTLQEAQILGVIDQNIDIQDAAAQMVGQRPRVFPMDGEPQVPPPQGPWSGTPVSQLRRKE